MSIAALDSSLLYEEPSLYTTVGDSTLDSEDFMTLLITQLENQDPMDPMDTSEMVTQVTQLSTMEATMEMAENMEKLLEYQTSQNNLQLLTLLGNEVTATSNIISLENGEPSGGEFVLSSNAQSCQVEILNSSGNTVTTLELGSLDGDTVYGLTWDGTTSGGAELSDGLYLFIVTATTAEGEEVDVEYRTSGQVTGIDYQSGTALLTLNGSIPVEVGSVLCVDQNG